MPEYKYKAAAADGRTVRGRQDASCEARLREILRERELYLVSAVETAADKGSKRLKNSELADLCRQMGAMLSSGLPLTAVLTIILRQELTANAHSAVSSMYRSVKLGALLSEAMAYTGGAFPEAVCRLVAAAEENGNAAKACMQLAEHYEREEKNRESVSSQLILPAVITILLIILLILSLGAAVPVLASLFGEGGLPYFTAKLLEISSFLQNRGLAAVLAVIIVLVLIRLIAAIPSVQMYFSEKLVSLKCTGRHFRVIHTADFCRTLSALYSGGLPLISACTIAGEDIRSRYVRSQLEGAVREIRRGSTMWSAFEECNGFDKRLSAAFLAGEESGRLAQMLEAASEALDVESGRAVKKLTELANRLLLAVSAAVMLMLLVSVMLPVYELYLTIG